MSKNDYFFNIGKGLIVSMLLSVVFVFIYATVLVNTSVQESTIKPVIMTIAGISILIGSSISSLKIKKKGIINGIAVGGLYFTFLYVISSIFACGFNLNISSIIMLGIGMILGGLGGIIGVNIGK